VVNSPLVRTSILKHADVIVPPGSTAFEVNALSPSKEKSTLFRITKYGLAMKKRGTNRTACRQLKIIYVNLQDVFKKYNAKIAAYFPLGIDRAPVVFLLKNRIRTQVSLW